MAGEYDDRRSVVDVRMKDCYGFRTHRPGPVSSKALHDPEAACGEAGRRMRWGEAVWDRDRNSYKRLNHADETMYPVESQ